MNIQPWKNGDPKISYTTAKRHLRILRRRLEEIMGSQPEPWWAAHHGPIYRRINGNSSGRWKRPSEETAPPCGQGIKQLAYLRTEQQRQCPNSCDYQRTVFRGLQPRYPECYTCRNRRYQQLNSISSWSTVLISKWKKSPQWRIRTGPSSRSSPSG